MCFVIEKGRENPHIAPRDIRCYKVMKKVKGGYRSYFQHFKYEKGVVYRKPFRIKLSEPRHYGDLINVGYHSYRTKEYAMRYCIHHPDDVVVCCVIPKGTLFFVGELEYVSNGIKIGGIVADATD